MVTESQPSSLHVRPDQWLSSNDCFALALLQWRVGKTLYVKHAAESKKRYINVKLRSTYGCGHAQKEDIQWTMVASGHGNDGYISPPSPLLYSLHQVTTWLFSSKVLPEVRMWFPSVLLLKILTCASHVLSSPLANHLKTKDTRAALWARKSFVRSKSTDASPMFVPCGARRTMKLLG
jgi:hypothetical protein